MLVVLEGEVERWKRFHKDNQELLSALDHFLSLFGQMMELEERAKDPSRLFNTRGGVLLQEEKAKKKVKIVSVKKQFNHLCFVLSNQNLCFMGTLCCKRKGFWFFVLIILKTTHTGY